jgi:hypothetical protein
MEAMEKHTGKGGESDVCAEKSINLLELKANYNELLMAFTLLV